jgi:hypothetical protein
MTIEVVSTSEPAVQAEKPAGVVDGAPKPEPVEENSAEPNESTEQAPEETEEEESESENDGDESDEETESKEADSDKPKRKSGSQRRKERAERAEARVAALEERLARFENAGSEKQAPEVETQKAEPAGKPDPEQYETHTEYVEALTDWKIEQKEIARKESDRKAQFEAEQKKQIETHFAREKAFMEKTPDYAEVVKEVNYFKNASPTLEAIIVRAENGPELMYELAKDPDVYERINKLGPIDAAMEIGMIKKEISQRSSEKPKEELKKITKAPKPIEPVGSSGKTAVTKDPEHMSQTEYEQWRRGQMKKQA